LTRGVPLSIRPIPRFLRESLLPKLLFPSPQVLPNISCIESEDNANCELPWVLSVFPPSPRLTLLGFFGTTLLGEIPYFVLQWPLPAVMLTPSFLRPVVFAPSPNPPYIGRLQATYLLLNPAALSLLQAWLFCGRQIFHLRRLFMHRTRVACSLLLPFFCAGPPLFKCSLAAPQPVRANCRNLPSFWPSEKNPHKFPLSRPLSREWSRSIACCVVRRAYFRVSHTQPSTKNGTLSSRFCPPKLFLRHLLFPPPLGVLVTFTF